MSHPPTRPALLLSATTGLLALSLACLGVGPTRSPEAHSACARLDNALGMPDSPPRAAFADLLEQCRELADQGLGDFEPVRMLVDRAAEDGVISDPEAEAVRFAARWATFRDWRCKDAVAGGELRLIAPFRTDDCGNLWADLEVVDAARPALLEVGVVGSSQEPVRTCTQPGTSQIPVRIPHHVEGESLQVRATLGADQELTDRPIAGTSVQVRGRREGGRVVVELVSQDCVPGQIALRLDAGSTRESRWPVLPGQEQAFQVPLDVRALVYVEDVGSGEGGPVLEFVPGATEPLPSR